MYRLRLIALVGVLGLASPVLAWSAEPQWGPPGGGYNAGRDRPPEWSDGRRSGYDTPYERGLNDGYEAGLKDARSHRRYDPISEGRYRSADRGYDGRYGSRDAYKNRYRVAFKQGYARGYEDARRYDNRSRRGWDGFFGFGLGF